VRQALRGLAETVALDEVELNDLSTAVTEACNNVVAHAYGDAVGVLEVEVRSSEHSLEVTVRDHGGGLPPGIAEQDEESLSGIGLPVIRALTSAVELGETPGGGTEVRMRFATDKLASLGSPTDPHVIDIAPPRDAEADETVGMSVGPAALARPVLRRVLTAVCARARFSTGRIAGAQRLSDELVAHLARWLNGGWLTAAVSVAPRHLTLTVGPLSPGSSLDGLSPWLERFADGHDIERADSAEVLAIRLTEPAPPRP